MHSTRPTDEAAPQDVSWRWRAIQCAGALLTLLSLILGFLPAYQPIALSASAAGDLLVLNDREVLRYNGSTGAFRNSVTPNVGGYASPGTAPFRYGPIARMTIGPDRKLYAITFAAPANGIFTQHILRFDPGSGALLDSFISNETQPTAGQIYYGMGIMFGPDGNLYVNDLTRILRYDGKTGAFAGVAVSTTGPYPPPEVPKLQLIIGMTFGPDGKLYVYNARYDNAACCLGYTNTVLRYDPTSGAFLNAVVGPTEAANPAYFNGNSNITFGPDGNLYLIGMARNQVLRYRGTSGVFMGVFVDHASVYPDPNDPGIPEPGGIAFGPDGHLYVSSPYADQIRRYSGTTGALLGIFAKGGRLTFPTDLVFTNISSASRPAQAAQVTLTQQTQPRLQAVPGDLVTTTLRAHNRGAGSAKNVSLTMPFDPAAVAVVDATFSRPSAWVSRVLSDELEIKLGDLGHNAVVTATIHLRVLLTAPPGASLAPRLHIRWDDAAGGGQGTSNQAALLVAASTLDAPLAPLSVAPSSGTAGTARTIQASGFLPGEPVALWYNTPDGHAVGLGQVTADQAGAIQSALAPSGQPRGWYSLVAYGTWSAITAVGTWQIE